MEMNVCMASETSFVVLILSPTSFVILILAAGIADKFTQVATHYPSDRELIFSLWFIEKNDSEQSFIKVDSHGKFQVMVSMYEVEKELSVYVMTNNNFETSLMQQRGTGDVDDEESEYSLSDESYHSRYSTDEEVDEENSAMDAHEDYDSYER
ncbi:hypothetical protein L1987_52245 [Smallanthus sonchifolius]|uniref:Uncharacterized protein n=1 Tax=Smallanthus sonchifolius TaxID=185202 RepID=A0ACB9ETB1_9ASTR|nr:hypothetical protein L1987_52245 [Smallanthus sonchifolius]